MGKELSDDMAELLRAVAGEDGEALPEAEPGRSPFAIQLAESIDRALRQMRSDGAVEIDDGSLDSVILEVTEAGLDARSPKQLIKRVIRTLIESEHVGEVYGTDDELGDSLKRTLGAD